MEILNFDILFFPLIYDDMKLLGYPKVFANRVMDDDYPMITRDWVLPYLAVNTSNGE